MEILRSESYLLSTDNTSNVRVLQWYASGSLTKPKAYIQLVHGMVEHVERYDAFARYLAEQGFAVLAHDFVGHGKSVTDENELGHIPLSSGKKVLIEDVHKVRNEYCSDGIPYVIFGHSMGSFIVRAYIARYGQSVDAAVICGTGNQAKMLSSSGNTLAKVIAKVKGETYRSKLMHSLADGAYSKEIKNARTSFDWLSFNQENVDAYIADPLCGVMFSVGGYAALTDLTKEVVEPNHAQLVPEDLPLLFIAGQYDPVGECGKAVLQAAALYKENGSKDVTIRIYLNMRHEILNENGKEQVWEEVSAWIHERIGSNDK